MRITLNLDEDILRVAKDMASKNNQSIGRTLSDLARRGLHPAPTFTATQNGLPVLPRKSSAKPVTSEIVKELLAVE